MTDLEGRGGGDGWWGGIDQEIQAEIVQAWASIIDATYAPAPERLANFTVGLDVEQGAGFQALRGLVDELGAMVARLDGVLERFDGSGGSTAGPTARSSSAGSGPRSWPP